MEYYQFLESLILAAGSLSLEYRQSLATLLVREKGGSVRDLVSEADLGVERLIREQILRHYPQHKILGEEFGADDLGKEDFCWLVDPIDGTVNFVKGAGYYSVSIALQRGGKTLCGGVYAPALGDLYLAKSGEGAWHYRVSTGSQPGGTVLGEGQKLTVRPRAKLAEAVLLTGFGCLRAGIQPNNYLYLGYVLPQVSDIRRFGSAALDLCMVAAGIFDGYWEIGLNLYDLAAGCLILQESGGRYSDLYGTEKDFPSSVLASGPGLYPQLLEIFQQAEMPYNGFRSLVQP